MFRRRRRSHSVDIDDMPTVSRTVDAARALSNLFTVLFFGGALSIVVMTFSRGV